MQIRPNQIAPQQPYGLFYFIRDHTDETTYYVQAKVYDLQTGELLDTVNLDQSSTNTRLFIASPQSPPDPVGYGRNIVAIATVYTDSGYTTKSTTYEENEQYFLIKAEAPVLGGGGGIDYRAMREAWREDLVPLKELKDLIEKLPQAEAVFGLLGKMQQEMNRIPKEWLETVLGAIGKLQQELNRVPKESFDDTRIWESLNHLGQVISEIPEPAKPQDLSPITKSFAANFANFQKSVLADVGKIRDELPKLSAEIQELVIGKLKDLETAVGKSPFQFVMMKPEAPKKEEKFDYSRLMR